MRPSDAPPAASSSPSRPARRQGWCELPIPCVACADQGRTTRLQDVAIVTHGGGVRCERCNTVYWVLVQRGVQLAYVAEVAAHELTAWADAGLTLAEVLRALQAPSLPRPAQQPRARRAA